MKDQAIQTSPWEKKLRKLIVDCAYMYGVARDSQKQAIALAEKLHEHMRNKPEAFELDPAVEQDLSERFNERRILKAGAAQSERREARLAKAVTKATSGVRTSSIVMPNIIFDAGHALAREERCSFSRYVARLIEKKALAAGFLEAGTAPGRK